MAQFVRQPISDPHAEEKRTAVQRIAAFAKATHAKDLKPHIRQRYKRNILDSLGCAIAALPGRPFQSLREQFEEFRSPGRCTLIGGGKTSPDQAAFFNSALVRYVDLLDSYMSPGGLCHPSDNFGAVLAAAEQVGASGEQFLLALAVSYEIQCRFTAAVPVMSKGFNHATQLAMSVAAAAGKLFGLSESEIANTIAIATADNVSLACVHVEPVSQWKGFSPGWTGMRAVYAASLAKKGFTGPIGLFEGPKGLEQMFGQTIDVNWEDRSLEFITQTVLKKFCSLIHGQPVLEATLDLRRSYNLDSAIVERVRCDIFQAGYDFAGGGNYGSKGLLTLKPQASFT
jgi:2-methylcitrate dehydratase